ncbi:PREDICTED: uncharacterized protein LOC108782651 [Cyphomyrmex costatus]|uniref:uncharacterized protein LOC108782651 n=1 Tax=Cyphomyrmex costatus TaxID=456900 RepID=UPI0008522271|nr:PREDICTED: uncharacterized protein LOC108782651 [Cyphomyrmex costatus]
MASSPFLAIRCLFALADEHQETYPEAANIIRKSMYVDDLLFGASSKEEAIRLANDISHILSSGCFDLRKWMSNDSQILERIGVSDDDHSFVKLDETKTVKTLGLSWSCTDDALIYHVNSETDSEVITKRIILSFTSRLYDPLGLLGPCIIITKIMLQTLWKLKVSWDDVLSDDLQTKWSHFVKELILLNKFSIPRQVCCSRPQHIEIHGFSDASEAAYGGCVYIRSINETGSTFTRLLCAKSKVAPLKPLTIPKLELSAAHLLTKLVTKVKAALSVHINSVYYWTDSTIVLSWLRLEPHRLQTFVRNRVAEIQTQSSIDNWRHIASADNPADLLSRGVFPKTLSHTRLWWHGPEWLTETEDDWPTQNNQVIADLPEVKELSLRGNTLHTITKVPLIDFQIYSKLERLVRIVAFCQRFINIKVYKLPGKGPLSAEEIRQSTLALTRLAQMDSFSEEIRTLSTGKTLGTQSKILNLNPFIHHDRTLRVGGRLKHSNFDFDKKHPMILDAKHPFTRLIFESEHRRLLHVGPQTLLAHTRERYWTIAGRNLARQVVHQCVRCFHCNPKGITPQMADLPLDRVSPAPVFSNVGTDYAGPFNIKDRKGRGCKTSKAYVCLFICMATKAIHLELVADLTMENFILALRRFASRRGRPNKIASDNGTNFVGAYSELQRLGEFLVSHESELQDRLVTEGINWNFIPAYSPHFGGIWEAGIKSTKHHLKRVIGNALLTYEEFYSVLVQIEAILNSRPLSPLSTHPLDLQPLTPAHFIIGRTMTTVPCPNLTDINENRLSHYQRIQQVQQNFWKRWSKEFISELQRRTKWKTNIGTLKIGDLVLVKEDNAPPLHWRLGRVSELHPGTDSITRAATIRTAKGFIRRATVKLCPLPLEVSPTDPIH